MDLSVLGWDEDFRERFSVFESEGFLPARVAGSSRSTYRLFSEEGEILAKISGKLRYSCRSKRDYPTVGDWVAYKPFKHRGFASIQGLVERKTRFSRKVAGKVSDEQVIAANIDTIFIVSGLDREFNVRRLERYAVLAAESGADYAFILNKTDLCDDVEYAVKKLKSLFEDALVYALSALNNRGLEQFRGHIKSGKTVVFLGSSGVGKSTIINSLLGEERQKTGAVSLHDGRGRHVTSSKNIILLPSGGLVIDTPGLRELQVLSTGEGLKTAFPDIDELSKYCKYRNCAHVSEKGCAVLKAVREGALSEKRLASYHKLMREIDYNASRHDARTKNKKSRFLKNISKQAKLIKKARESADGEGLY